MNIALPSASKAIHDLVGEHARTLSARLQAHRLPAFPTDRKKDVEDVLVGRGRQNSSAQTMATFAGFRSKAKARRSRSAPTVVELTRSAIFKLCGAYLDANSKSERKYLPWRRGGEKLQVITVVNFKGGSGKTTTAAHLAQYLALHGYRVLAVDLDPQASLSALHGVQPEFRCRGQRNSLRRNSVR